MYHVYALSDPRTPTDYRYVGLSQNLQARLYKHINRQDHGRIKGWRDGLLALGLCPSISVLESFTDQEPAQQAEREWISKLGEQLLNMPVSITAQSNKGLSRMDEVEQWAIQEALGKHNGNKAKTAKYLGIGRQTLYNKLGRVPR